MHLTCLFHHSTEEPSFVFWYHEDTMISFDQFRGIYTSKNRTGSNLTISTINHSHSGNYSCVPSNTRPASITVHILDGKYWPPLNVGYFWILVDSDEYSELTFRQIREQFGWISFPSSSYKIVSRYLILSYVLQEIPVVRVFKAWIKN